MGVSALITRGSRNTITYNYIDLTQNRLPVFLTFASDAKGRSIAKTAQCFLIDGRKCSAKRRAATAHCTYPCGHVECNV